MHVQSSTCACTHTHTHTSHSITTILLTIMSLNDNYKNIHVHACICTHACMYVYACMCLCLWLRVCVCVCVCLLCVHGCFNIQTNQLELWIPFLSLTIIELHKCHWSGNSRRSRSTLCPSVPLSSFNVLQTLYCTLSSAYTANTVLDSVL